MHVLNCSLDAEKYPGPLDWCNKRLFNLHEHSAHSQNAATDTLELDHFNALITSMLPGVAAIYEGRDSASDTEYDSSYPTELCYGLDPSNPPPFELSLKVGQYFIFLLNTGCQARPLRMAIQLSED